MIMWNARLCCWGVQGFVKSPPSGNALTQRAVGDAYPASPSPKAHSFAVIGYLPGCAAMQCLLLLRGPYAILRAVSRIIVNAVDSGFRKRFRPHVSHEVDERVEPSVADSDAPAPVQVVVRSVRLVATSFHFLPGSIFRGFVTSSRTCPATTARFSPSVTLAKIATGYSSCFSALALAQPAGIAATGSSYEFDHGELSVDTPHLVSSVFTASARLNSSVAQSSSANHGSVATFATAVPVRPLQGLDVGTSVTQDSEFPVNIPSFIFDVGAQFVRIAFSHLNNLLVRFFMVVRAARKSVLPGGSFHFYPRQITCQP